MPIFEEFPALDSALRGTNYLTSFSGIIWKTNDDEQGKLQCLYHGPKGALVFRGVACGADKAMERRGGGGEVSTRRGSWLCVMILEWFVCVRVDRELLDTSERSVSAILSRIW